ncbi:MAG: hypothetical protein K2Y20_07690 [Sphingomonas sp.]|nr:hypothetical protein [Sphingomonas sp.]
MLIETPYGPATGSAVQEIELRTPSTSMMPIDGGRSKQTGDALLLRVDGKNYFMPLTTCASLVDDAIRSNKVEPAEARFQGNNAETLRVFARSKGRAVIEDGARWMKLPSRSIWLTRFADERDFRTSQSFRLGDPPFAWSLRSVTVETVDEPITRQTIERLPWLKTLTAAEVKAAPRYNGYTIGEIKVLSDLFKGK